MNPFTANPDDSIADWGELRLIDEIRIALGDANPPPPHGIGDDAAVLEPPPSHTREVVTTDGLVWGRHFDERTSPGQAAAKLVNRNLSDIAAMGAQPSWMVFNLLAGPDLSKTWLQSFATGLRQACLAGKCSLVGGDIAEAAPGTFSGFITAGGVATRPLLRTGARTGDTIWVTGWLGGSLAGSHATFTPRLEQGLWLASQPGVRSCIDLSDGLAKDLPTLLPPGGAAALNTSDIPLSPEAGHTPGGAEDPLQAAFLDGEDYELLFTVDANTIPREFASRWPFADNPPLHHLGTIIDQPGDTRARLLDATTRAPLDIAADGGYRHLRRPS